MSFSAYDLTGRSAFVTGAASGIGRATAIPFAQAGATVHCADLDEHGLKETAALIARDEGAAHVHPLDVTERSALAAAVGSAGPVHVMAAVAGIMHTSPASCPRARSWRPATRTSTASSR